jgi:hypothetical protein
MIVINRIAAGRQNVPLREISSIRRKRWPPLPALLLRYFTAGTRRTADIIYLFSNMHARAPTRAIDLHILI